MNHISDWLTHIDHWEDAPYLKTKLLDVNMRLFRANISYRHLIEAAMFHLERALLTKLDGYSLPYGTSGANVGIPWNIIAIAKNRGDKDADSLTMINPSITKELGGKFVTKSNCGSIRLDEPIKVERSKVVQVKYYDRDGVYRLENFYPNSGSFTIQHEIDHNNGILITDREIK